MFNKAKCKFLEVQRQNIDLKIKVMLSDFFVGDYRGFNDIPDHMSLILKWRVEKHLMDINASLEKLRSGSAHALSPAQQQDVTVLPKTEVVSVVNPITMF